MRLLLTIISASLISGYSFSQQWQLQLSLPDVEFNNINFLDENTGYVFGDSSMNGTFMKGMVMKTDNGGVTWNELDFGSPDFRIFDSYILNGTNIYAVGRNAAGGGNSGLFVMSNDGGITWSNTNFFPERLFSVGFIDQNNGWAGGKNGFLSSTSDGGSTWSTNLNLTSEDILDLAFHDSNTGLIACGGGELFRTTDAGVTWNLVNIPTSEDLSSISIRNNHTWISCGAGDIIYSSDDGATWSLQSSGTLLDLSCISFYDHNSGYAAGPAGLMISTVDGGSTYLSGQSNCINDIVSMSVTGMYSGWFCTPEGEIFSLTNPTGIEIQTSSVSIKTYPNPVINKLHFDCDTEIRSVRLMNMQGAVLRYSENQQSSSGFFEVSELNPGIYLIDISTSSGKASRYIVKN